MFGTIYGFQVPYFKKNFLPVVVLLGRKCVANRDFYARRSQVDARGQRGNEERLSFFQTVETEGPIW